MPLPTLLDKLPSVPSMHLATWIRPTVLPALDRPQAQALTADTTLYSTAALQGQWSALVGSPAPIDRVLARFNRSTPDLKVLVDSLSVKPAALPDLPAGKVASSFFSINLQNAQPADVNAAAAMFFVE
ncbi:MAG: hypothetical protein FJ319_05225 [SAR202 cluster bacterium]|nr:hypothetical protein [SAR202 cluster bacterium]